MMARLETMVLMGMDLPIPAIRGQLSSGLDLVVHLGRLRDCSRKLLEVDEVCGIREGEVQLLPLYRYREEDEVNGKIIGHWQQEGELQHTEKLAAAGIAL